MIITAYIIVLVWMVLTLGGTLHTKTWRAFLARYTAGGTRFNDPVVTPILISLAVTAATTAASYVVSRVFAPKVKPNERGKVVGDLAMNSQYDQPIPEVYGADTGNGAGGGSRLAGQIIWIPQGGIRKVVVTTPGQTQHGGKGLGGGGSKSAPTETTTYYVDIAIAFAINPTQIGGYKFKKVWANTDVIYTDTTQATGYTGIVDPVIPPDDNYDPRFPPDPNINYPRVPQRYNKQPVVGVRGDIAHTISGGGQADVALYPGNETQLQDPTMQAEVDGRLGAGSTPAYRGLAYIVLKNFNLSKYGGLPNFTASLEHDTIKTIGAFCNAKCAQVGLNPSEYDFSQVAGTLLRGLRITQQEAPRRKMEDCAQLYNFDFTEDDGKIIAVINGGASVATIADSELGAYSGIDLPTEGEVPEMDSRFINEADLPRTLSVGAIDPARDFESNAHSSTAVFTTGNKIETLSFDFTGTPDEMSSVANRLLYQAHVEREGFSPPLMPKYAWLKPTDIITIVRDEGFTHSLKLISQQGVTVGVQQFEAVAHDTSVFNQAQVTGVAGGFEPSPFPVPAMSICALMNIPLLREQDANLGQGFYAAATKRTGVGAWAGATLYVQRTNWEVLTSFSTSATMGRAVTVLPTGTAGALDSVNSVTIDLYSESRALASVPQGTFIYGSNTCVLGDEVVQFTTATRVAGFPMRWTISGLQRGVKNTGASVGTHVVNERFILVDDALQFVPLALTEKNTSRNYKCVTIGQSLADAATITFSWTPPAPPAATIDTFINAGEYGENYQYTTTLFCYFTFPTFAYPQYARVLLMKPGETVFTDQAVRLAPDAFNKGFFSAVASSVGTYTIKIIIVDRFDNANTTVVAPTATTNASGKVKALYKPLQPTPGAGETAGGSYTVAGNAVTYQALKPTTNPEYSKWLEVWTDTLNLADLTKRIGRSSDYRITETLTVPQPDSLVRYLRTADDMGNASAFTTLTIPLNTVAAPTLALAYDGDAIVGTITEPSVKGATYQVAYDAAFTNIGFQGKATTFRLPVVAGGTTPISAVGTYTLYARTLNALDKSSSSASQTVAITAPLAPTVGTPVYDGNQLVWPITAPASPGIAQFIVQDAASTEIERFTGTAYRDKLVRGTTSYARRFAAVNKSGFVSASTVATTFTSPTPATLVSTTAALYDNLNVVFAWTVSAAIDLDFYEVRDHATAAVLDRPKVPVTYLNPVYGQAAYAVDVFAVSKAGLYSAAALALTFTVPNPAAPTGWSFDIDPDATSLQHIWTALSNMEYQVATANTSTTIADTTGVVGRAQTNRYNEQGLSLASRIVTRYLRAINNVGLVSTWTALTVTFTAPVAPVLTKDAVRQYPTSIIVHDATTTPRARIKSTLIQIRPSGGSFPVSTASGTDNQIRIPGAPDEIEISYSAGGAVDYRVAHEDIFTAQLNDQVWSAAQSHTFTKFQDIAIDPTSNLSKMAAADVPEMTGGGTIAIDAAGNITWSGAFTLAPLPAGFSPTGQFTINAYTTTGLALTTGQLLLARFTKGSSAAASIGIATMSSYTPPAHDATTYDRWLVWRRPDGKYKFYNALVLDVNQKFDGDTFIPYLSTLEAQIGTAQITKANIKDVYADRVIAGAGDFGIVLADKLQSRDFLPFSPAITQQFITHQNTNNVTIDTTLSRVTATAAASNAAPGVGQSVETILSRNTGSIEAVVTSPLWSGGGIPQFGLGHLDANGNAVLDYYFELTDATYFHDPLGYPGFQSPGVTVGDILRIEIRANGKVYFLRNGTTIFTSTVTPANYPYHLVYKIDSPNLVFSGLRISHDAQGAGWMWQPSRAGGAAAAEINAASGINVRGVPFTEIRARAIQAISTDLRYIGNDFGTIPPGKVQSLSLVSWKDWLDGDVEVQLAAILPAPGTDNSANQDSIARVAVRVLNQFAEQVAAPNPFDFRPGGGTLPRFCHARSYADPETQAVYEFRFENHDGFSTPVYLQGGVKNLTLPTALSRAVAPLALTAAADSDAAIRAAWFPAASSGTQAIQFRRVGASAWQAFLSGQAASVAVVLINSPLLTPATWYDLRVLNEATGGGYSNVVRVRTADAGGFPQSATAPFVTGLTARVNASTVVLLNFSANGNYDTQWGIDFFRDGVLIGTTQPPVNSSLTYYQDSYAVLGARYVYTAQARYGTNGVTRAARSNPIEIILPASLPASTDPSNLAATSISTTRNDLAWRVNDNTTGSISIDFKVDNGDYTTDWTTYGLALAAGTQSYSHAGLSPLPPGQAYAYRVRITGSVNPSNATIAQPAGTGKTDYYRTL